MFHFSIFHQRSLQRSLFFLFTLLSLTSTAQNVPIIESNASETAIIETRCECLQRKYELKKELIENTQYDENGRLIFNSNLVEKRAYTYSSLMELSEKCSPLMTKTEDALCPSEGKLTELDEEFKLIIRVMEMSTPPHDD